MDAQDQGEHVPAEDCQRCSGEVQGESSVLLCLKGTVEGSDQDVADHGHDPRHSGEGTGPPADRPRQQQGGDPEEEALNDESGVHDDVQGRVEFAVLEHAGRCGSEVADPVVGVAVSRRFPCRGRDRFGGEIDDRAQQEGGSGEGRIGFMRCSVSMEVTDWSVTFEGRDVFAG